jgi:hypothetical protein
VADLQSSKSMEIDRLDEFGLLGTLFTTASQNGRHDKLRNLSVTLSRSGLEFDFDSIYDREAQPLYFFLTHNSLASLAIENRARYKFNFKEILRKNKTLKHVNIFEETGQSYAEGGPEIIISTLQAMKEFCLDFEEVGTCPETDRWNEKPSRVSLSFHMREF